MNPVFFDLTPFPDRLQLEPQFSFNIRGIEGSDTLLGNFEDNSLQGNQGNDFLWGGDGNDILQGGKDGDQLEGGQGNDTLIGDLGIDFLWGNEGADVFILQRSGELMQTNIANQIEFITPLIEGIAADFIADFDPLEGDIIVLPIGLTQADIAITYRLITILELTQFGFEGPPLNQPFDAMIQTVNVSIINEISTNRPIGMVADRLPPELRFYEYPNN